jgi:molecular chaperone HtpG
MQKLLEKMGQSKMGGEGKRILEINPNHPIFEKMSGTSEETKKKWSEILYYQALLFEGSPLPNPHKFSEHINDLMIHSQIG